MNSNKDISKVGDFVFLSENNINYITSEIFLKLLKNKVLSPEDQEISQEIIDSLDKDGKLPYDWSPQESEWMEKNHPSKWLEYILYRFKFRLYPKRHIVPQFPIYLLVEPTSACNLRCPMCFQSDKTFTKKAWFYKHLRKDLNYYTIEAYTKNIKSLFHLKNNLEKYLNSAGF